VSGPLRLESSWPHDSPDPRVVVLVGHTASISVCRFSLSGDRLVTGDQSGRLLVRDVLSGEVRADLRLATSTGHLLPGVTACATGADDQVAAGLVDGTVHLLRGAETVRTFPSERSDEVTALAFSADGQRLLIRDRGGSRVRMQATGSGARLIDVSCSGWAPLRVLGRWLAIGDGRDLAVWDLDQPDRRVVWSGHGDEVIAIDRLGGMFVTTDVSGVVRTWIAATGRCAAAFIGATGPPAVDPDADRLVLPTREGVRICDPRHGDLPSQVRRYRWQAATRRRAALTFARMTERLPALADRADALLARPALGTTCLAGPRRSVIATIRAEDDVDGEIIRTAHALTFFDPQGERRATVRLPGRCAGAAPVPGTERLATVTADGVVSVWDATGAERLAVETDVADEVTAVALNRRGDWLAVADLAGRIHVVDPRTEGAPWPADPRAEPMIACAVDPRGRWVATAAPGRAVVVWDLGSGEVLHVFRGHPGKTWADQFTPVRIVAPHGSWLAYSDGGGRVRVRDPLNGVRLAVVPGEGGELGTAAHARWFCTTESDGRVRLWSPDGALRQVLEGHVEPVRATATTTDGAVLATACASAVRVWRAAGGQAGPTIAIDPDGLGAVRRLLFGPNGVVVLAGDGPELRLHDATDGRRTRTWTARSPITTLAADPAMMVLVTGHLDGTTTTWSLRTGTSTALGARHRGAVTACAVDSSGALVATGDTEGELQLCDLESGAVTGRAGTGGEIADCRWTPDGRVLVTGRGGVHLFSVTSLPLE
jgi:WD40 repeat protein